LLILDVSLSGLDGPIRQMAVPDNLGISGGDVEIGVGLDPDDDLSAYRICQKPPGPIPEDHG
jgi:hypothetical protein